MVALAVADGGIPGFPGSLQSGALGPGGSDIENTFHSARCGDVDMYIFG